MQRSIMKGLSTALTITGHIPDEKTNVLLCYWHMGGGETGLSLQQLRNDKLHKTGHGFVYPSKSVLQSKLMNSPDTVSEKELNQIFHF